MSLHIDPELKFVFGDKKCFVSRGETEIYEIDFESNEKLDHFKEWVEQYQNDASAHHEEFVPMLQEKGIFGSQNDLSVIDQIPTVVLFGPREAEKSLAKRLKERGLKDVRIAKKAKDFAAGVALLVRTKENEDRFQEAMRYCVQNQIPALTVFMDEENDFGIVGPFHTPRKSACHNCITDKIPAEMPKISETAKPPKAKKANRKFQEKMLQKAAEEVIFEFKGKGKLTNGAIEFSINTDSMTPIDVQPQENCICQLDPKELKKMFPEQD